MKIGLCFQRKPARKKTVIAGQESKLSPSNLRLSSTLEAVDGETEASKASERVPQ